jgi:cytochrome c oxidase subunit 3
MYVRDWQPVSLPAGLLAVNTLLLALSSFTIEMARRHAAENAVLAPIAGIPGISLGPKHPIPWMGISGLLGAGFLVGQGLAWRTLVKHGLTTTTAPGSSFFYVLTGAHAAHLLCGLLAVLYAISAPSLLSKTIEARSIIVDITAWYWHAMAGLWLCIIAVLSIAK